jgi:hypothetical protein
VDDVTVEQGAGPGEGRRRRLLTTVLVPGDPPHRAAADAPRAEPAA